MENMSFLEGIIIFFTIHWPSGVGGQRVNSRLSPVIYKPPNTDQTFDVQTPTDSQCIYICAQNNVKCLALVYDRHRSLCVGYRSLTANQSLTEEEQTWHIIYKG